MPSPHPPHPPSGLAGAALMEGVVAVALGGPPLTPTAARYPLGAGRDGWLRAVHLRAPRSTWRSPGAIGHHRQAGSYLRCYSV